MSEPTSTQQRGGVYPRRLGLLNHIAHDDGHGNGHVWRGYTVSTGEHRDFDGYTGRVVTAYIEEMERAGWIELQATRWSDGTRDNELSYWTLTAAGEALLRTLVKPVTNSEVAS